MSSLLISFSVIFFFLNRSILPINIPMTATLFYRNSAIQDMLHDFLLTQEKSQQITLEDCHARPLVKRACSYFLALLSPML